jgi:hypothetical protein
VTGSRMVDDRSPLFSHLLLLARAFGVSLPRPGIGFGPSEFSGPEPTGGH